MTMRHNIILAQVLFFCCLIGLCHTASAGTPMSDRVAVDAGVKAEIAKDLASPYSPHESLSGRTCLDGRPVDGFQGDIVELWSNLECPFCGIQEPLQAQRDNPLKTAEQTTEQNGNMIDGIINNTPTVDELEAKVKAGEQISLVDLANAVKADKERGKGAKPEKKPSIRAQLRADKEKAQKKNAKQKSQDLERS